MINDMLSCNFLKIIKTKSCAKIIKKINGKISHIFLSFCESINVYFFRVLKINNKKF